MFSADGTVVLRNSRGRNAEYAITSPPKGGLNLPPALSQLTINRIIIHEVPRHLRSDSESSPAYSEVESPLNDELRVFFKEKIIETVGSSSAYDVIFDATTTSPVPPIVRDFLARSGNFVEMSKVIAKHLHDAQGGVSPGGLVTVVDCGIEDNRAIGILKLEKEAGVRLRQTTHEGLRTFDVSYIRDLILTRKTKLFKIGFFYPSDGGGDPSGAVCDEQRGYMPQTEIASFFLTDFLGCCLAEDPRIATKRFFTVTQDFFNEQIEDPVERTQALMHLLSEVTNQRTRINVREFARSSVPTQQRQAFLHHLEQQEVGVREIRKNTELIDAQTKKMALEFENGVTVVGTREAFRESVQVERARAGTARVEITGKLKRVKGK
jgi:nucleoid associated protein NdpA